MKMSDIDEQIQEAPLTKEEARAQFIEKTEKFDLKHTFSFDEVWDTIEETKRKKEFREKIVEFEQAGRDAGMFMSDEDLQKANPLKHSFADGCYIREIFNPAGQILVTKIHKKEHPFFLLQGEMSILTEDGIQHLKAPHHGITRVGTKRIIYTHTDCVFITVHATDKTNIAEIEEDVIAKGFDDKSISEEDFKELKTIMS